MGIISWIILGLIAGFIGSKRSASLALSSADFCLICLEHRGLPA
jgi:hypothetical protein